MSLAFVLGAIVVLLAACGGDEATPTPVPTLANPPTATPTIAVNSDGVPIVVAGNTISVHYRGTLDDGEEFDSSAGKDPLTFTVAAGQMIPGFDAAVEGMALGGKKTVRLEPGEAYGERFDELILEVPLESIPPETEVGRQLFSSTGGSVTVTAIEGATVTLDANHPLAGQALTFDIEIVEIN